jgi:hypothetical protein
MTKEYRELRLVRVTSYGNVVEYFAVDEKTEENMQDSSTSRQYIVGGPDYEKLQFDVECLGKILVQI